MNQEYTEAIATLAAKCQDTELLEIILALLRKCVEQE